MKSLGGYFELELSSGKEYHDGAVSFNNARNAFEYILLAKGYKKVYLPYYTCDVMLQPIIKQGLEYEFYHLDPYLYPEIDKGGIHEDAVLVYNNYFGLCDKNVRVVSERYGNLMIDNAQAFYSQPLSEIDTIYSPRKFFGVPDGGYLYTGKKPDTVIERDRSAERTGHLLKRIDSSAEEGYQTFINNEKSLSFSGIKAMSLLTQRLLQSINYQRCANIRRENFSFLHKELSALNHFPVDLAVNSVPMIYPLLTEWNGLRDFLIEHKIYVATYWKSVSRYVDPGSWESRLVNNLIPLPIDQRYDETDMRTIVKAVLSYA